MKQHDQLPPLRTPKPADIRAARRRLGLSQTTAARLICVTQSTWSLWEQGVNTMNRALWFAWRIRAADLMRRMSEAKDVDIPVNTDPEEYREYLDDEDRCEFDDDK